MRQARSSIPSFRDFVHKSNSFLFAHICSLETVFDLNAKPRKEKITNEEYQRSNLKNPIGVLTQKKGNADATNIAPTTSSANMKRLNLSRMIGWTRRRSLGLRFSSFRRRKLNADRIRNMTPTSKAYATEPTSRSSGVWED